MSYYQYYQQQPQWGTAQYQVVAPPRPVFQPQPNWNGSQYFRAQAGLGYDNEYDEFREEGFFDNIWRGLKGIFSRGFSRDEARMWHSRVYGGQISVDQLDPAHLGAAAGYEAIRHWSTYRSTYRSPLADDREREKEALAGLAAGEAVKLLSYSPQRRSTRTRREAAEIAAATAERIFAEDFDDPYDAYESNPYRQRRTLSRRRSSYSLAGGQRPIVATTTGGGYISAQPTGTSYVSATPTGVSYTSGSPAVYAAAQSPVYTGSPGVQYVQSPGYVQQAGSYFGATPGQQVAYTTTGQPMTYASTGVQYATAATSPYGYAQQQYVTSPGAQVVYPQQQYAQQQYITAPAGYSRARALSTGGYVAASAPGYVQYR